MLMTVLSGTQLQQLALRALFSLFVLVLASCAASPEKKEITNQSGDTFSIVRNVHSDHSMITLLDPADLTHHQAEPADWYLHDFAIKDDLQTGRFAAVLTDRSGNFKVRVTNGELTDKERKAAGAEARMRLRVINHRLLLGGGDAWPSVETDHRFFASDPRWISIDNGDYGVIITSIKPGAAKSDYVFQLIAVSNMAKVKYAPGVPQLIYGQKPSVVGVNSKGFDYREQCNDVPAKATWAPLAGRTMPIPGAKQTLELPRSMHTWALKQQRLGSLARIPLVLSRDSEEGTFGFFIKPSSWNKNQLNSNGDAMVNTLVRCAVVITGIDASPNDFAVTVKPLPTANDRLTRQKKTELLDAFDAWLRAKNDPAWLFKVAKADRSTTDSTLILGILDDLRLSSKESESVLPLSNALRVDYLLDRLAP